MSSHAQASLLSQARKELGPYLQFLAEQPVRDTPPLGPSSALPPNLMSLMSAMPREVGQERAQLHQPAETSPPPLRAQPPLVPLTSPQHHQAPLGPPPQLLQAHPPPAHASAQAMAPQHSLSQPPRLREESVSSADHHRHSSISGQNSIDNDSGEEDEDEHMAMTSRAAAIKPDDRRMAHTVAEQKRRDDIKHGYEELAKLIPSCQPTGNGGQKLSKAIILQRAIDYMAHLKKHRQTQDQDLTALRNEVMALRIMKRNYEQIAKAHQAQPPENQQQVSDAAKFEVFKAVMDTLFQSFDASISVSSFESLSGSIFNWLEEFCKPQNMRGIVISSLQTSQKGPAAPLYGPT